MLYYIIHKYAWNVSNLCVIEICLRAGGYFDETNSDMKRERKPLP